MIRISSKIHGIEIGGMRHPMQTVHYREDQITPEQLEAFQACEFLTVEVDAPATNELTADTQTATDEIDQPADPVQPDRPTRAKK